MSSPTINTSQTYGNTSLLTIMNLARSLVNDTQAGATDTPGEGQIFTDDPLISPFTLPFLNSAIRELYRELRNCGDPTLIRDNVIVSGLTPVFSPSQGTAGQPDPAVQVQLTFDGYFDGNTINNLLVLPEDVIYPERMWERQSGTQNLFVPMVQSQFGLPSRYQMNTLADWEWRENKICMVGSLTTRDVRLRYWAALPQFFSPTLDFASTFVPILDCTDAVAYKTAVKYANMLGAPGKADLAAEAREQLFQLKNSVTRRAQSVDYQRIPYGSAGGGSGQAQHFLSWQ